VGVAAVDGDDKHSAATGLGLCPKKMGVAGKGTTTVSGKIIDPPDPSRLHEFSTCSEMISRDWHRLLQKR